MARLTQSSNWLMQQIGGEVVLFHEYTEEEVVRFDPANPKQSVYRQIDQNQDLTNEEKWLAGFWAGYFYAHAKAQER